jgi:hypothetical protein
MSIEDLSQKINSSFKNVWSLIIKGLGSKSGQNTYIIIILILSSLASFGLGRLSKTDSLNKPIKIIEPKTSLGNSIFYNEDNQDKRDVVQELQKIDLGGKYVASKSGTKYHLPWCSGALSIKEGNKVWFNSKEEAEKAGYLPASNCKGI